jgi:hypothetical protein
MTKKLTPKTKVLGASQNRGAILVQNNVAIIFLSSTPKIALVILLVTEEPVTPSLMFRCAATKACFKKAYSISFQQPRLSVKIYTLIRFY